MSRSRNWCYTLNNYSEGEYDALKEYDCIYNIIGKEVGENGTPHLQGYIEFKNAKRLDTLKNFNQRIHWEIRKGSAEQAIKYCEKDNNYIEIGTRPKKNPGKRTDLDDVADLIKEGGLHEDVCEQFTTTYIKFHKGIDRAISLNQNDRSSPPEVIWRWGKAGVGKTRYAVEKHESHYIKDGTQWWDGYRQEEAIIIDDFDGRWPYRDLLRLLDRYKYQGQTKGGYVKINSPYIYITCEYPPEHFWEGNELAQIKRRLSQVTEVPGNTSGDLNLNEIYNF